MDISGVYRHFKGREYFVLGEAVDCSGDRYVLYKQLYPPFGLWIRPWDMFFGVKLEGEREIRPFTHIEGGDKSASKADILAAVATHSETEETYEVRPLGDGKFSVDRV